MEVATWIKTLKNKSRLTALEGKYLHYKLKKFRPKIKFSFVYKNYEIKTVNNKEELLEVLKLRYQVFTERFDVEFEHSGIDFDKYDLIGDHIILKDLRSEKIIGTYRVLCSSFTKQFYSQNEFNLDQFLKLAGVKMELGRASIHPNFRNGATISLIWRAIAKYATQVGADYLFGCTSVDTVNPFMADLVFKSAYLDRKYNNKYEITTMKKFQFNAFEWTHAEENFMEEQVKNTIPPLMRSYISAGAKFYSKPAIDRDFQCVDLCTVLDFNDLTENFYKRYFKPCYN